MKPAQRATRDQRVYGFDGFCLDPQQRRLTFEQAAVTIPPKPFDALLVLLENAGTLMSKQDLHQHLWPDTFVEEVTLARTISDLRHILAQHSNSQYIETVSKHGYRFVAQVRCFPAEISQPAFRREITEISDAGDLVLRAWHAARQWTPDAFAKGLDYARRAIAANPACADAHAVLAYLYLYAGFGFFPGRDAFPRAKAAATIALSLDPRCGPAHAILGMLRLAQNRDLKGAEESFRKSIELAPNSMAGHFAYSHLLLIRGQFQEALEEALLAMHIDPLSCPVAYHLASILYYAGRNQDAIAQLLKFEFLDPEFLPAHDMLAVLYAGANRKQDSLREAAKACELAGTSPRGKATLAIVHALLGMHDEARSILREIQENTAIPGFRWSYARAAIHSHLREPDAAFECIYQACEEGDGALIYLRFDPHFAALRGDYRFTKILGRIGLQIDSSFPNELRGVK